MEDDFKYEETGFELVGRITREIEEKNIKEWAYLKNNIKENLKEYLYTKTKRNPMILPILMEV